MKRRPFFDLNSGKTRCLVAVLGAIAIGSWLGWRSARQVDVAPPTASPLLPATPAKPAADGLKSPGLPEKVRTWIAELENATSPADEAAAAARLVFRLTPEDWPLVLTYLGKFPSRLTRSVLESAVVRRWAEADPVGAAEWGLKNQPALAAAAAGAWVRQDRQAAAAWFESLPLQKRGSMGLQDEYYAALLKLDFAPALAVMRKHGNDESFGLGWAEQELVEADPAQALELSTHLKNPRQKKSIEENVARELGRRDALAAIQWAQQQPDPQEMLTVVFQQPESTPVADMIPALASLTPEQQKEVLAKSWPWWERGDPFLSLDGLKKAPEGLTAESRRNLVTRALERLGQGYGPEEIANRLQSGWPEFTGLWEKRVAATWTSRDSEAARAWIAALPDGPAKEESLQAWQKEVQAKQNRQTQLANQPKDFSNGAVRLLSETKNQDFFPGSGLMTRMDFDQRRQLWDQIAGLPEAPRGQAQENFMTYQALSHPDEAAVWLGSQPASPATTQLASQLAANWALDDAPAAAAWAGSLPAGETKTWALWNLGRHWQRVDDAAARRWAGDQPDADRAVLESAFAGSRPQ